MNSASRQTRRHKLLRIKKRLREIVSFLYLYTFSLKFVLVFSKGLHETSIFAQFSTFFPRLGKFWSTMEHFSRQIWIQKLKIRKYFSLSLRRPPPLDRFCALGRFHLNSRLSFTHLNAVHRKTRIYVLLLLTSSFQFHIQISIERSQEHPAVGEKIAKKSSNRNCAKTIYPTEYSFGRQKAYIKSYNCVKFQLLILKNRGVVDFLRKR